MPISEDVVGYLPTINAPATELNTVFEILNQSERIRKELLLEAIVVVMDQALFAKAAEIAWNQKELFPNIRELSTPSVTPCPSLESDFGMLV